MYGQFLTIGQAHELYSYSFGDCYPSLERLTSFALVYVELRNEKKFSAAVTPLCEISQ